MKNSEKKEWVSVPLTREQLTILEQAREEFAKRNEGFLPKMSPFLRHLVMEAVTNTP
jgi:hypothetical protein